MTELVEDLNKLKIMEELVSGNAVSVNISELARILGKHRNTIKKKIDNIFEYNVLDPPIYPFNGLYRVYPLLAIVNLKIPIAKESTRGFIQWVKEDPKIFAAFKIRQGEYDTILFTYHESITAFQLWMSSIPDILEIKYRVKETKFESSTAYFSNQLMIKYNPSTGINLIEKDFKEKSRILLRNYELDELDLQLIRCLVNGKGIKTNITLLSDKLGFHRKTIEKRIEDLLKDGTLGYPICRFPNFFVPPNYLLTYILLQVKELDDKVLNELIIDPNVPIAIQTTYEKFNMLIFGNHKSLDEHLRWEESYRTKFPDSFGSAQITYLSPEMTINFNQQIVSLCYIRSKLGKESMDDLGRTIRQFERLRAKVLYNLPQIRL